MATTLKQKTGESWQEMLKRHEKRLNGEMSTAEFQAVQRRVDGLLVKKSDARLLEIGRSFVKKD